MTDPQPPARPWSLARWGKHWGLRRLADAQGLFSMVAIDQRPPIVQRVASALGIVPGAVGFADIVQVKALLAESLAPQASALLVDPDFGLPAATPYLQPGRGLLITLEEHRYDDAPDGRRSRLIPNWSVAQIRRLGADAVKLLAWYRPDASDAVKAHQQALVRAVGQACAEHDIAFVLELLVHPFAAAAGAAPNYDEDAAKQPQRVITSVRDFARPEFGIDLFKLESPVPMAGLPAPDTPGAAAVQDHYQAMGEACGGTPWVLLSAGGSPAGFGHALGYACQAGASGFLAGRAVWWDALAAYPDADRVRQALRQTALPYLQRLREIVAHDSRPWRAEPDFGAIDAEGQVCALRRQATGTAADSAATPQPYWMPFSPNKEFKAEPKLFARAEGMNFYTPEGQQVIDASSGLFCVAAGHCRREIAEAVYQQLQTLDFTAPFLRAHPKAIELANRVIEYTPAGLNRVFFVNSGSEAVDTAMKTALMYHRVRGQSQRQLFVSRERAYHGDYHMRHTALPQNKFVRGQPEQGADLADDLQRLSNLYGGENIAACFVEPTAGSFGCLPPPQGYLNRLRQICDDNGILLVFDEVITGWGRLGANFGAQAFGVTPDLLTMAKAITNGAQPMGALAARQEIYDTITEAGPKQGIEFFHGYTCSAHPAACAAGLAMMDIFRDEQLIPRAAAMSPYFIDAAHSLADLPGVVDIRSIGMMAAVKVAAVGAPGARGHALQKQLYDRGLHLKSTGDSLIIAPAFIAERRHIDEIVGKVRDAISA